MARILPREAELVLEWTGLPGEESVKRFERSNGLDTALYNTILLRDKFGHQGDQKWVSHCILHNLLSICTATFKTLPVPIIVM